MSLLVVKSNGYLVCEKFVNDIVLSKRSTNSFRSNDAGKRYIVVFFTMTIILKAFPLTGKPETAKRYYFLL